MHESRDTTEELLEIGGNIHQPVSRIIKSPLEASKQVRREVS